MINYEIYDLETLINLFTYTGYDCINKKWRQFLICSLLNQISELVDWLYTIKDNNYYMIGFNNENFDYPIIHHIINHYEEYICGHYEVGRYAWIVEDVKVIEPIEAKGILGLWNY